MRKQLIILGLLCFGIHHQLGNAAGSFGGLVVPNMGQVKGGQGVSYYMDAPWGRVYVTEQGLLLNIITPEMRAADSRRQAAGELWSEERGAWDAKMQSSSPFSEGPYPTYPFSKGRPVPLLAKEGLGEIYSEKRGLAAKTGTVPGDVGREVWTVPAFVGAADMPVPAFSDPHSQRERMRGKFAHAAKSGDSPSPLPTTLVQSPFFAIRQTGILLTLPGACWREVVPEDPQITKLNFFYGNDPKGWVTDVPTYKRLRVKNIFPGTDLVLEPKMPGFFRIEGLSPGLLDVFKQQVGEKLAAFGIAFADNAANLVDPNSTPESAKDKATVSMADGLRETQTLIWGTYLGGYGWDWVQTLAVDANGDVIAGGGTYADDFPVPGGYDQYYNGEEDIFVAKLSGDGRTLHWGTYIGGRWDDKLWAMALDIEGNIVIGGATSSDDFPTTADAFDTTFNGYAAQYSSDIFINKLSTTGNSLLWSTYIGGENDDVAYGCVVDEAGNVILAGFTTSPDIPVPGGFDVNYHGTYSDIYIAKLSRDGKALLWASYLGGTRSDHAYSICLDASENVIVAGSSSSPNIPTPDGFQIELNSPYGYMYIADISITDNRVIWGTFIGGTNGEAVGTVAVDSAGSVIVVGGTNSADMPVPGGFDSTYNGYTDMYAAKLSSDGKHLLWGTYMGGKEDDSGVNAKLDEEGNIVVLAWTESTNLPVPYAFDKTAQGEDFYITKLSSSGGFLHWGSYMGGSGRELAGSCALDATGNVVVAGMTNSTDFPVTDGYDTTFNGPGYYDGVIAKLSNPTNEPPPLYVPAVARTPGANGTSWRTDGMLLNSTPTEVCFNLYYIPSEAFSGSETFCGRRCLAEGRAFTYRDILGSACGVTDSGAGSLRIEPEGELTLSTRTYNEKEDGGTYGQFIPAMPGHEALTIGDVGHIIGLKQTGNYRTNLGFSEITGNETEVELRIYNSSGFQILTSSFELRASGWWQVGLSDLGITSLDVGRAEVEVTSGGAVLSYASIVDNRTGDAVYLPGQKMPTIIPGILGGGKAIVVAAKAQGANETNWRTELTLYNPEEEAYDITFTYRCATGEYAAKRFVPSGHMMLCEDVIGQIFPQIKGDSAGTLEVWPSTDLFVSSRTYNLTDAGTYGQGVPAEKINNIWSVGHLFPMMQTADYRTNIGLIEVSGRPMDVQVSLFDSAGSELLATAFALEPFEWRQVGISELGISHLETGWAEISAISAGGLHFYASVVDNRTGDAIFIPASK